MIYEFTFRSQEHLDWYNNYTKIGDIIYIMNQYDEPEWAKVISINGRMSKFDSNLITDEVNEWMKDNNITHPLSEENKFLIQLRFG